MKTEDIPSVAPSDWQPITDKHDLAVLGKFGEEVNELGSALFRCIIQGIDECEPVTGKINRQWLEEEIADVMALTTLAIQRLDLNLSAIMERRARKIGYKAPWFVNLRALEWTTGTQKERAK